MRAKITDVARLAGVSPTTVSHALSGARFVSPETSARVLSAAKRLGYQPSRLAGALRTQRTGNIAMIVPDMANYFYTTLVATVADCAFAEGLQLLVRYSRDDPDYEAETILQLYAQKQVDGIILVPTVSNAEYVNRAFINGARIVAVNRRLDNPHIPGVASNNKLAAETLTQHLLRLGHTRIGVVLAAEGVSTADERLTGITLAAANAASKTSLHVSRLDAASRRPKRCDAYLSTLELVKRIPTPTALIGGSLQIAEGMVMALRDAQIQSPNQMAVVAFGTAWAAQVLSPRLTVMEQGVHAMATEAVNALVSWIETDEIPTIGGEVKTRFVLGDSCGWKGPYSDKLLPKEIELVGGTESVSSCPCGHEIIVGCRFCGPK